MIVYCCSDLIFATKVRSTAESLGVVSRPVRDAAMLQARLDRIDDGRANDPVSALIVDLDTEDRGLALIDQARSHDASLPIIAFGPHVAVELLGQAQALGAHVMTRGAFTAKLPELIGGFASTGGAGG